MAEAPAKVLTIEDEATVRRSIASYLEDSGYEMIEAENGRAGLEALSGSEPDVVLCDLRMPEMDGLEVLKKVAEDHPEKPFIVVSGTGDMGDAIQALKLGAWDYIRKPIEDMAELEHSIEKALERARLLRENRESREHLEATNRKLRRSLQQLEEDEQAARQIQIELLPPPELTHPPYAFSHHMRTSAVLSGDFLDYFQVDDKHWCFFIADVSGHGVSSAFITVLVKSTMNYLREQYRAGENDAIVHPDKVLKLINADIAQQGFNKYLTIFYAVTHEDAGTMTFSNGGHFPFPVLVDEQGANYIQNKNLPVGLFEEADYPTRTIALPERFALALFSDGVLEILPHQELKEKEEALLSIVGGLDATVERLTASLGLDAIEAPVDDITLMLVKKGT